MQDADLLKHGEEILERALANGGDFAEIFFEERHTCSLGLEDDKAERIVSGTEAGVAVRVVTGDETCFAHSNDTSPDGLRALADTVAGGVRAERRNYAFDFRPERCETPVKVRPQDVPTPKKLEFAAAANRVAREADPRVVQVAVRYGDSLRRVVIVNSEGRFVEDARPQTMLVVQVVAARDGVIQTGYRAAGGTVGLDLFDEEDPETIARAAARQACLMLEAEPAPDAGTEARAHLLHRTRRRRPERDDPVDARERSRDAEGAERDPETAADPDQRIGKEVETRPRQHDDRNRRRQQRAAERSDRAAPGAVDGLGEVDRAPSPGDRRVVRFHRCLLDAGSRRHDGRTWSTKP